jgi:argininosuccinate synthase
VVQRHASDDLAAYVQSTQRFVTGTVRVKLFKGNSYGSRCVSHRIHYYSFNLATYDKGDIFDQRHAVVFHTAVGLYRPEFKPSFSLLVREGSSLNSLKTKKKGKK